MSKDKDDDKSKALALVKSIILKSQGKDAIMHIDPENVPITGSISTGSINLDKALGIGGIPKGRITEIYGDPGNGKTTLALHSIAEAQKRGEHCVFIDVEHAIDLSYAQRIGVDVSEEMFTFMQPVSGEYALQAVEKFTKSGAIGLVVLDSVDALLTKNEIEGEIGDSFIGNKARLMGDICRKLPALCANTDTAAIFINQIRMKVNSFGHGSPKTTSGGNALKFYSSVRMEVIRTGALKGPGTSIIGNEIKVKVVKNKLAPPFKEAEFQIVFGKGIDIEREIVTLAVKAGVIEASGSWYSYDGEKIGQGMANVLKFLEDNPEKLTEIKEQLND